MEVQGESNLQALSPLYLERGLFALRYVSADDPESWPTARVFLPQELNGKVRQICAPGVQPGLLSGPGACLVLHAESPGLIRIGLRPATPNGSLQAVIKLERLDLNASNGTQERLSPVASRSEDADDDIRTPEFAFLAHVARRGDVQISPGQWVAGPEAPAPIEGLLIKPHDFATGLEIQVLNQGASAWSSWCGYGVFAGTRGRARPVVGFRARLDGPMAHRFSLVAEAMFLGSPLVEREGQEIELFGNFNADPLVGLRLVVKAATVVTMKSVQAPPARKPRLKVFRSNAAGR